jgi:ribosomal protein L11 methyltransferase
MKNAPLRQVTVVTSPEAGDAVAELLAAVTGQSPAVYTNEETRVTAVSVYCARRAEWTLAKHRSIADGLKRIRAAGLNIGAGKIETRRVKREDWAESWKRHFRPIEIGARLLIKPSWVERRPKKNQAVVVLDPGLSFGTGNHPTTAFCLRQLATRRTPGQAQSFWDVGTGSGILAIAAVKLGYAPVRAMDFDPEAVRVAKENARQNGVAKQLRLSRQDVTRLPSRSREKFDVICANLISNLLIAEKARLARQLAPGGTLVVAGILAKEFREVQQAFDEIGLKLADSFVEGEWRSGAFAFGR